MHGPEPASMMVFLTVFLATGAAALAAVYWMQGKDRRRALARLRELSPHGQPIWLRFCGWLGTAVPGIVAQLSQGRAADRAEISMRFTRAGIYGSQAPGMFLGVKLLLSMGLPIVCGLTPYLSGLMSLRIAALTAVAASGVGLLLPTYWLAARTKQRQTNLRLGLPDLLDMMVLCLESGISLTAAIQRVTSELWTVHPLLAAEMAIAQREMQMGLSAGEALQKLAVRCDLEELRDLANVLLQTERFGGGAAKSLRTFAETWRQQRQQQLEELAQKAAVKILFPTLLCIFPAVF